MEFRELPLGEHIGHQEGTMSRGDMQTPYLPPFLCPTVFYIWLFLSSILYRKFLTVNEVLTLWVVLVSYQSGEEGREPSGSIRIIRWKVGICEWILKWGQSSGTVPLTCGALRRHLGLVSEWVCVRESLLHIWCQSIESRGNGSSFRTQTPAIQQWRQHRELNLGPPPNSVTYANGPALASTGFRAWICWLEGKEEIVWTCTSSTLV